MGVKTITLDEFNTQFKDLEFSEFSLVSPLSMDRQIVLMFAIEGLIETFQEYLNSEQFRGKMESEGLQHLPKSVTYFMSVKTLHTLYPSNSYTLGGIEPIFEGVNNFLRLLGSIVRHKQEYWAYRNLWGFELLNNLETSFTDLITAIASVLTSCRHFLITGYLPNVD